MWKFDPASKNWTYVIGSKAGNSRPTFPNPLVAGSPGTPSSRSNAVTWVADDGNLWMYGGYGTSTAQDQYQTCMQPGYVSCADLV